MRVDPNLIIALVSVLIAFVALIVTISRNGHTDIQKQLDDAKEAAKVPAHAGGVDLSSSGV